MSPPIRFKRILVANRGEIACRVFRSAKACGYETVAVYSEADADSLHVRMADHAVCIGPAPVNESYLCGDALLKAALETGADAIHPGYGFLSENAEFARACADDGVAFIGPSAHAIEIMGNKAAAKRLMLETDVPCIPGYQSDDQSESSFQAAADTIGYPVMVKAAAGGGGRGMRLVEQADDLPSALSLARSEAENAFGSGELILEKAVVRPRHVEVQVFADKNGNTIHLGERDCSLQRRHQKVIEEAPCPVMTEELRAAMGMAAINAAKAVDYVGAGTVEFLLDQDNNFYFLEMNTRLQVEHPVTEMITGLDLVEMQIRVAEGRDLGVKQQDVQLTGHAIEARLYAEDPEQDFLPATGTLQKVHFAEGVRIDTGVTSGTEVSPFYDPMIAKVIGYGKTREEALAKLNSALRQSAVFGLKTNLAFLISCLSTEKFAAGETTTAFIEETTFIGGGDGETKVHALVAGAVALQKEAANDAYGASLGISPSLRGWSSASNIATPYQFQVDERSYELDVQGRGRAYEVKLLGDRFFVDVEVDDGFDLRLKIDGVPCRVFYLVDGNSVQLSLSGRVYELVNQIKLVGQAAETQGGGVVLAPMHGLVTELTVCEGAVVKAGQCVAVLEAMKMQHQITAPIDGTVSTVSIKQGDQVAADSLMFEIAEMEGA